MTKEEMIELAKQSGWEYADGESGFEPLWAFAKLVAEKEREACIAHAITAAEKAIDVAIKLELEACAKICEEHGFDHYCGNVTDKIAKTIRARIQA